MARGSFNIIEQHLEKGVLGLAVLYLLAMFYMFLIRSPNKVDYGGQQVGPRELAAAMEQDVQSLRRAIDNAPQPATDVPNYSVALRAEHEQGIFANTALPKRLPRATSFGVRIPSLVEEGEASGRVVLVTPHAPSVPVARTGRNLALRRRPALPGTSAPSAAPTEPVELAWVTVAAYFDVKAQRNALSEAGYATHRSGIYLTGVDVERQERLASGEFGEWQPVLNSSAMPRLDIPQPEISELTGTAVNRDEMQRVYNLVKQYQDVLLQPSFYSTLAGESWRMPPLEGYADPVEVDGSQAGPGPGGPPTQQAEGRDKARDDLEAARQAFRNRRDRDAESACQRVLGNASAVRSQRDTAQMILNSIALDKRRAALAAGPDAPTGGPAEPAGELGDGPVVDPVRGPRTPTGPQRPAPGAAVQTKLITHPDEREKLAVWFHDDSVVAGKTYRYRLRVRMWNRYVMETRALRNPEQARLTELAGSWSVPSEPITVAPSTYFFLASGSATDGQTRVDVWKWRQGNWLRQSFSVGIGDTIGGVLEVGTGVLDRATLREIREPVDFSTGALVLDIRAGEPVVRRDLRSRGFQLRDVETLVLVYLDPADGQVKERAFALERADPMFIRLATLAREG
jgi:hypothetical protein